MNQILEYKCPYCGGRMEFDAASQNMKCPYCDSEIAVSELQNMDAHLEEDQAGEIKPEEHHDLDWQQSEEQAWTEEESSGMAVYTCKSCGGEIVADENLAATSCPYCDNPIVLTGRLKGELKPDYIIPFKLDKKAAKEGFNRFISGKKLLPKIFKDQNHIDEIKGLYVPFWIFDAKADARMSYKATKVRTWSDSENNYTETSFFEVDRSGILNFDRIPVDGSSQMADELMESIEPFDFKDAVPFQTAYMSGYMADKYDVTKDICRPRADERLKHTTTETIRNTITGGYATVSLKSSEIYLKDASAKYAMYPVWILNTTFNGEHYIFAMNGQTGKFAGNLPIDKGIYWKLFGMYTGIIGVIVSVLLHLFL